MRKHWLGSISFIACSVALLACDRAPRVDAAAAEVEAKAVLAPTAGNEASGTLTFAERDGVVEVSGPIAGLKPGKHGFHVHETGNCDCPDAKCAGGHFAPAGNPHGAPSDAKRHVGDLGNVTADDSGVATIDIEDKVISLQGEHSIIGKAMVVHAGADDLHSQPSGDSGDRVACGVVKAVSPTKG